MRVFTAIVSIAVVAVCSSATAGPAPPTNKDVSAAFRAAFGSSPKVVRHVVRPPLSGQITIASAPVALALRPAALTPLGDDLYALLVFEDDAQAAHVEPGAIAVAYLHREGSRWSVLRTWPELAWTGNDGNAADSLVLERLGGKPLALFSSSLVTQGRWSVSDWVIDLEPQAPRLLGEIPLAGSLFSGCDSCGHYDYQGHIVAGTKTGELLSVRYAGWTAPATEPARMSPFARRWAFVLRDGKLAPAAPLHLPDQRS